MWFPLKLLVPVAMLALFVLAQESTVEAAEIAAAASLLNTWMIVRHDRKVALLEARLEDLQRQLRSKRVATRGDEGRARVLDIEPMKTTAQEIIDQE